MNYDTIYEFVEPHLSGGTCTVSMTARQVVEWNRKVHRQYSDLPDPCDEDLLADFISAHWASPTKELDLRAENGRLRAELDELWPVIVGLQRAICDVQERNEILWGVRERWAAKTSREAAKESER